MRLTKQEFKDIQALRPLAEAWGYRAGSGGEHNTYQAALGTMGFAGQSCERVTAILMRNLSQLTGPNAKNTALLDCDTFHLAAEYTPMQILFEGRFLQRKDARAITQLFTQYFKADHSHVQAINGLSKMNVESSSKALRVLALAAQGFQAMGQANWAAVDRAMQAIQDLKPRAMKSLNSAFRSLDSADDIGSSGAFQMSDDFFESQSDSLYSS
jgi:hypothetical protein